MIPTIRILRLHEDIRMIPTIRFLRLHTRTGYKDDTNNKNT